MANAPIARKYRPRQPVKIGERFGRLVVIAEVGLVPKKDGSGRIRIVRVRCDCGTEKEMVPSPLRPGIVVSCGCKTRENARALGATSNLRHGDNKVGKRAPEYGVYRTMLSRCYNPNVERYPHYGGRGIRVCDRWMGDGGYERFIEDMRRRPKGLSIERENRDGDYEPGNCSWAAAEVQSRNRSNNRVIEHDGISRTLVEWGEVTGIAPITIHMRIKAGWGIARALTQPLRGSS